jgi:hypothetical protein
VAVVGLRADARPGTVRVVAIHPDLGTATAEVAVREVAAERW